MRLGLVADIHEDLEHLRWALTVLRERGVDRIVVLGDVFEMGHRLDAAVALLDRDDVVGVWGNHDFGLCHGPLPAATSRYAERTIRFLRGLRPRLEVEDALFIHVEPWLDPEKIEDLWYFDDDPWYEQPPAKVRGRLDRSFKATPQRLTFLGHFHRWLLAGPEGIEPWSGDRPVVLGDTGRRLVIVHAVCEGRCALYDTDTTELIPFRDVREG